MLLNLWGVRACRSEMLLAVSWPLSLWQLPFSLNTVMQQLGPYVLSPIGSRAGARALVARPSRRGLGPLQDCASSGRTDHAEGALQGCWAVKSLSAPGSSAK